MSKWGSAWGSQWGCEIDIPNKVEDICKFWLWWQYQNAPNMQALCRIFTDIFNELEDNSQRVSQTIGLDGATGGELDAWAKVVNVERLGVTDDLLRRKIQAAARAAFGEGRPRDFYEVMTLIAPDSNPTFAEVAVCVRMFFFAVTNEQKRIIFELMRQVPGLGICLQYVEIDPSGQVFEFSYLESVVGVPPRDTFDIQWHWDFAPHLDIPPQQKAGFAFLIEA